VVVLTHAHQQRTGIRYLANGVKIYYAPLPPFAEDVVLPVFVDFINVFRHVVVREGVTVVHGHQVNAVVLLFDCTS
jgi:phosphatidylinositol N-acetylglucosaminyltransferase subunit A